METKETKQEEDPLFAAIREGDLQAIQPLLDKEKKDNNENDDDENLVLQLSDRRDVLDNYTPLMAVCVQQNDDPEIARCFCNKQTVRQATEPKRNLGKEAMKNIKWALWFAGIKMNDVPMRKHTPLVLASQTGNLNIVKLLVQEYGADVNQNEGWTALMSACFHGHLSCVEYLLQQGADATLHNLSTGSTPLLVSCMISGMTEEQKQDRTDIVRMLFQNRTPTELALNEARTNTGGNTAVIAAASGRNPNTLRILLQHGADLHAVNEKGWTALDHAIMRDSMGIPEATEMATMLLEAGAKARPGTFSRAAFMGGGMSVLAKLWPSRVWSLPTKEATKNTD